MFRVSSLGFRVSSFGVCFLTTRTQKQETRNSVPLGSCFLVRVADDPVNHQTLFFAFDADLSNPIEHEAVPKIVLRALVDQNPA